MSKTVEQLNKEIEGVHAAAKPLRDQRESVNNEIERLKVKARELSRQISSIEAPITELQFDLSRAQKIAGRLHKMPVEQTTL
jgi:predicted  nucleic acid-binding Zn-ribbon protein